MEVKVSVVIPVYNAEKYLVQCLESVKNQTLKDIQIICVNDGSTDKSLDIINEYAQNDSRFVVINQKNCGCGKAYNVGMAKADGEFIGFVEPDDYISDDMYETLYSKAVDNGLDMVKAQCYYCWDSIDYRYARYVMKMEGYYNKVLTGDDRNLFYGFFMNTWSGIYKKSFLDMHHIRHHESKGASFQDNGFWMLTTSLARSAMWLPDQLYLYRRDNENQSINGDGKVYALTEEYDWVEKQLRDRFVPERTIEKCHYWRLFRNKGNLLRIADEYKKEFANQIFEDYRRFRYSLPGNNADTASVWYRTFIDDPKKFCDDTIARKREIINKLEQSSGVVILGTDTRGEIIKQILFAIGYHDKLRAFIQPGRITRSNIGLTPVRNIFDPQINIKNLLIILAEIPEAAYYTELKNALLSMNVNLYIEGEDILKSFYYIF